MVLGFRRRATKPENIEAAVKRLIEVDRSIKGGITDELSNSNRISADRQSQ